MFISGSPSNQALHLFGTSPSSPASCQPFSARPLEVPLEGGGCFSKRFIYEVPARFPSPIYRWRPLMENVSHDMT